MAALAVLRADWCATIAKFLTAERDLAVTRAIVDKAGAVDGVTARSEAHGRRLSRPRSMPA